jgi:predicted GNAT family acetyltransferase
VTRSSVYASTMAMEAVVVETEPEFRRRGYALSCLRVVTARATEAGIAPRYGTEEGNTASRRTAERAGYALDLHMFWVTVDPEHRSAIPARIQTESDQLR